MTANTSRGFIESHAHGLAALLKLRAPPNPQDGLSLRTFNTTNLQMVLKASQSGAEQISLPVSRSWCIVFNSVGGHSSHTKSFEDTMRAQIFHNNGSLESCIKLLMR